MTTGQYWRERMPLNLPSTQSEHSTLLGVSKTMDEDQLNLR